MKITNLKPTEVELKSWGVLAHISATERDKVLKKPTKERERDISDIYKALLKTKK